MNPLSSTEKNQTIFSAIVFISILALALFVFYPFLTVLALSIIFAVLLSPLYRKINSYVKFRSLSAGLTLICLLIVIVVPIIFLTNNIVEQAQSLYTTVGTSATLTSDNATGWIETRIQRYAPDFTLDTRAYLAAFSSWIVARLGGIFSGTVDFIFKLALSFVALFYLLRDGDRFKEHIIAFTPWNKERDIAIIRSMRAAIKSVVIGSLVVAVIQGLLAGIGFTIAGVPNATLWGTLAAICALVPGVGTAFVWVPAVIFLFLTSATWTWVFLLAWSLILVGLIDNFLGPILIERGVNIHPLLILFSVLGGIQFFGPEGFLLGPLVLSVLFVLIRVFKNPTTVGEAVATRAHPEDVLAAAHSAEERA